MLREADLHLPKKGWGRIDLAASASRAGTARTIPVPPELVRLLRAHIKRYGTTPDGRAGRARDPPGRPRRGGRPGLELVAALATRWGWRRQGGQTVTWFELCDLLQPMQHSAVSGMSVNSPDAQLPGS
jgi:hypothetical protein